MHNVECLSETSYMAIAIVVWCVVLCAVFAPQIVCVVRELTKRTRDSLASSSFLFLMVGIAIVYAGGKTPVPEQKYPFSCSTNELGVVLLAVTNNYGLVNCPIPEKYSPSTNSNYDVVGFGDGFPGGKYSNYFTNSIVIPKSVVNIGENFFADIKLSEIHVANGNTNFAVTCDGVVTNGGVLYEISSGRSVYPAGSNVWLSVVFTNTHAITAESVVKTNVLWGEDLQLDDHGFKRESKNKVTRDYTYWTQNGWSLSSDSELIDYEIGSSASFKTDVVLYPHWCRNTLVLHTNATFDVETKRFSSTNLESAVEYTNKLDGCVFAGWSRSEHGDTNWIEYVKANLKANCPTSHLYAIWVTNDCYAIAFDPGEIGGEWTMPRQQIKTNQVAKLNPCQFSPSGTNFLYWVHGSRIYDDGVLIFNLHNPDQNHDQDQSRVLTFKAMWEVQQ